MATQEEYNVHLKNTRIPYIKIEILDVNDIVIDSLTGVALDGSVNISADSLIRRTASVKFILSSDLIPSETSKIWINNRVRLWVGLKDVDDVIYWFRLGVFIIKNPDIDITINERTISLELADKMCLLENKPLSLVTQVVVDTIISDAVLATINSFGEPQYSISTHPYTVPYKLEFNQNQTYLDVIKELKDLYMNWQCYYDVYGKFNFKPIPNTLNDPIVWDFLDKADFVISSQTSIDYENVKNYVTVIGKTDDTTGVTATYTSTNTNVNSPFSITKIGNKELIEMNDKYFTNSQCKNNADYLLWKHSNFNEEVSITCAPIYYLDVEQNIKFNSSETGLDGTYCINSLTIPLTFDGVMSLSGYRVYS